MRPWNDYYHVMFSPYGQWLRGDSRGWRERHHREHCDGDYRNPPLPTDQQKKKFQYSQQLLKRPPVELNAQARQIACDAIVEKWQLKNIGIAGIAVGRDHVHGVIRCLDHDPRRWVGLAKKHAAFILVEKRLAERGGVWGKRSLCKPIESEHHFHRAVDYVLNHAKEGAVVWSASQSVSNAENVEQQEVARRTPTEGIPWALGCGSTERAGESNADRSIDAIESRITEAVREVWGFDSLRPLQMDAIRAGLEQHDSLVVLPTGGGKSLCYQTPPLITGRLDVVVSPLISLMRDQVDALRQNGYPAAAVHSSLTSREREEIRQGMRDGAYRLMFVSPERLLTPRFIEYLQKQNIRSFAIDEAHCISQWGHDFRPEYRQLEQLRKLFPDASLHAYTATATERVRADIIERLSLRNPNVLVGVFDRPNLTYRIVPALNVETQTLEVVQRHKDEAVIVYCLSRKDTEYMAESLKANGINAAAYHAGMAGVVRSSVQDAFASEKLDVVCATVAFGMGIDRSNVRCVIHASMPKSIEHYQQETGRAGRDGLEAECVLLYSIADLMRWERLIEKSAEQAADPEATIAAAKELLNQMAAFCTAANCRHRMLTEYFGQTYEPENCGACDYCLNEIDIIEDSTTIAKKILSCVARLDRGFGVNYIVDVLRGANTAAVRQWGHESLSTYGILREWPDKALAQLVYQLVDLGLLQRTGGDRPVVHLTDRSRQVLRGEQEVGLVKPTLTVRETQAQAESWEGVDHGLFEHLRALRKQFAGEQEVPAFVIFSDATLRDMARRRPTTKDGLRAVQGIGDHKLSQYGDAFIEAITAYCAANGVNTDEEVLEVNIRSVNVASGNMRPNPGKNKALDMLRGGHSIAAVRDATGRAESTLWGYLTDLIAQEPDIDILNWVDQATYDRVLGAASKMEDRRLRPIFEALNEQVPYEFIRIVLTHAEAVHSA